MRLAALVNTASGGVPKDGPATLSAFLAAIGFEAGVAATDGSDFDAVLEDLLRDKPEALVVWGGDGAAASVLSRSGADGPPVLPLPGGTMNLLHKAHYGARSWREIAEEALAANAPKTISAGDVDGRRFYVAAFFGALTRLARSREALRDANVLQAIEEWRSSDALNLDPALSIAADGAETTAVALAAFLSEHSGFAVGALQPGGALEVGASLLSAALIDMRVSDGVDVVEGERFIIRHREGEDISATLDGEPTDFGSSVTLSFIPDAARILSIP